MTSGCEVQSQSSQYMSMAIMFRNTATFFPVDFKARWILPHDLSAKGKMSQRNVRFTRECASSCWQLREWSWHLSTPFTGSILRPKLPHVLPSLTVRSRSPASALAMLGIRWFKVLQKLTLAEVTMYLRLGSWRRESQCLEDGSERLGPRGLPWVSMTTTQVGEDMHLPLPADFQGLSGVWAAAGGKMKMYSWKRTRGARNTYILVNF